MRYILLAVVLATFAVWLAIGLFWLMMQVIPMVGVILIVFVLGALTAIWDERNLKQQYHDSFDNQE